MLDEHQIVQLKELAEIADPKHPDMNCFTSSTPNESTDPDTILFMHWAHGDH
jgi:hypothetical protein